MLYVRFFACFVVVALFLSGCKDDPEPGKLHLSQAYVGSVALDVEGSSTTEVPVGLNVSLTFSTSVNPSTSSAITLTKGTEPVNASIDFISGNKTAIIAPLEILDNGTTYTISISNELHGANGSVFTAMQFNFKTVAGSLIIESWKIGDLVISNNNRVLNVSRTPTIEINFSVPLNPASVTASTVRITGGTSVTTSVSLQNENKKMVITTTGTLAHLSRYSLLISNALRGSDEQSFAGLTQEFHTVVDLTPKLPLLPNDEDNDSDNTNDLLSVVQKQTFKYFWDFAQPASGMARERNTSGDLITSGGSGFGIMSLIVGMERNFITRAQGLERMDKILDFLENADRFHGAWSHWINGNTGDVIPFGSNDNGGDLVETAFLVEGLISFRQYLNNGVPAEQVLINRINTLWQAVEWDWYRKDNENVLYWHWSPDKNWVMNHQISGWNEALIVYVLAAAAPANNTIPKVVYENGWARNGDILNGSSYEGTPLPLGFAWGGPLFFTHYSWMGLDPHTLSDQYASSYWTQNVNHSIINYKYCVRNPKTFAGYSEACWGLTASDSNVGGYNAHSPTNDHGVISPTAALSSFPYTPEESMRALKFFYYTMGDRLWGEYGFYDAFNPSENWYTDSYLAIDQGPIIVMIENYRTGLIWELFMSAPEVQAGLDKLGFDY
jgi:hypothetical protein